MLIKTPGEKEGGNDLNPSARTGWDKPGTRDTKPEHPLCPLPQSRWVSLPRQESQQGGIGHGESCVNPLVHGSLQRRAQPRWRAAACCAS